MNALLSARQLYLGKSASPRLSNVDITLQKGERLGLLGINGAGKSTLMQVLAGVLKPDRGSVSINEQPLYGSRATVRRHIGYLPQRVPCYAELSVYENMRWAAELHAMPSSDIDHAIEQALQQMNLLNMRKRLAGRLSGGMAQRLGLAQAILHQPDVLLLDEPTAGLDPVQTEQIRELLAGLAPSTSLIIATHLLEDINRLCGRVALLDNGRKTAEHPVTPDTDLLAHLRLSGDNEAAA